MVSFIGGGNRRKYPTCRKSLTSFIKLNVVSSTPCHQRGSNSQREINECEQEKLIKTSKEVGERVQDALI